ncbi:OsmC family protein [Haloplanus sp. GCM10025708]|uniref:OsmC family protein n=1 Tax=Haloplanus sp. GCM10025708 TaxID=3252679 RepID=UPI00360B6B3E
MSEQNLVSFGTEAVSDNATKTTVEVRDFELVIDEPESLGGTDDGPNPLEYVLASLSGCLNVVGHLVADEMDIDVRSMSFSAEGDVDPRKFQGTSDEPRAGYEEIRVTVDVDTDADEETLDGWIATVEERCPVTDNLRYETPLDISVSTA